MKNQVLVGEKKRMRGIARINSTHIQRLKQLRNAEKKRALKEFKESS